MENTYQKDNLEFQSQKGMVSENKGEGEDEGQREYEVDSECTSTNGSDSETEDLNIDKMTHLYSLKILDTSRHPCICCHRIWFKTHTTSISKKTF